MPQLPAPASSPSPVTTFWQLDRAFPPPLPEKLTVSTEVQDRDGQLLRAFATPDGYWRLETRLDKVDKQFVDMLVAYEDKRFWDHDGVDVLALARAAGQFVDQWPYRLRRLDAVDAACPADRAARQPQPRLQDQADAARHADRAAAHQARDPRTLPDAGALWRQSGRRARRLARLFRQGAEAAHRLGSRPARRPAATAGKAPARPQPRHCARRARPRADPHGFIRPARRTRGRARRPGRCLGLAPHLAGARRSRCRMPCCEGHTPASRCS